MKRRNLALLCAAVLSSSMIAACGTSEIPVATTAAETQAESSTAESEAEKNSDKEAADHVAELIDSIYVQEWNEDTDKQCREAKAAWDALTDEQKELVEGEEADPDYFGRDTGDASKDDPVSELRNFI